ncbi:hypothetical protein [Flexithrix dorotheae]|uniref:hypothetical protein n=1 Tax=Flexithrix dorotheae TaxID=70993 RepID=UPI0003712CE1|nr:hypothetical protein [Flexithrix dorotheae]
MKSKLRTIVVQNIEFKYLIREQFIGYEGAKLGYWITKLRVFRSGWKNTPIEVTFKSQDGYGVGNLLTTDTILNDNNGSFNLYKPSIIRKVIEKVMQHWNWEEEKFEIKDGMDFLKQIGFDFEGVKEE